MKIETLAALEKAEQDNEPLQWMDSDSWVDLDLGSEKWGDILSALNQDCIRIKPPEYIDITSFAMFETHVRERSVKLQVDLSPREAGTPEEWVHIETLFNNSRIRVKL